MRKTLVVVVLGVFALSGCSSPAATSNPDVTGIPEYSFETSEPDVTDIPDDSEKASSPDVLKSKYRYFLKNDKIVVEALLEKRCMTNGWLWIDFTVKDTGDYIFVVRDSEVNENGQLRRQ